MKRSRAKRHPRVARTAVLAGLGIAAVAGLGYGSWKNPHFWLTANQRGDRFMAAGDYGQAASTYEDPWRIGMAQYRDAAFEDAAHTFARVPGATGFFDQGNAWLMHGQYASAIESYDRALALRPGWPEALDNKALAEARQAVIDDAGANRAEEQAQAYDPDETVIDPSGDDDDTQDQDQPQDMNGEQLSDAELRATWLRRVQTTPDDFLRAKFAYQAARGDNAPAVGAQDGSP